MSERLFGTDGVRGVANSELSPELALRLGLAAGYLLQREPAAEPRAGGPIVVVGTDSRISSPMLEAALSAGLCAMGVDVVSPGLMPTPAVARITRDISAAAGVMISASHNPFADNGIKFFGSTGYKLDDALENRLESLVSRALELPRPVGPSIGHIRRDPGLRDLYAGHVADTMAGVRLDGLKIVVDGANGAASDLGPRILRQLGRGRRHDELRTERRQYQRGLRRAASAGDGAARGGCWRGRGRGVRRRRRPGDIGGWRRQAGGRRPGYGHLRAGPSGAGRAGRTDGGRGRS